VEGNTDDIRVLDCGGTSVIGQIGSKGVIVYTANFLPQFSSANLKFRVVYLDSWDNEQAWITVNGQEVWRTSWSYSNSQGNICANPQWPDHISEDIRIEIDHLNANSLTIKFFNGLDEDRENESFGINYLRIRIAPIKAAQALAAGQTDYTGTTPADISTSALFPAMTVIMAVLFVGLVVVAIVLVKRSTNNMESRP